MPEENSTTFTGDILVKMMNITFLPANPSVANSATLCMQVRLLELIG